MSQSYVFVPLSDEEASVGRMQCVQSIRAHVTRRRHEKSNARNAIQTMQPWTVIPYRPSTRSSCEEDSPSSGSPESRTEDPYPKHGRSSSNVLQTTPSGSRSRETPIGAYPIPDRCNPSRLLSHYIENFVDQLPELNGNDQLRRQWFPLAMTEPAAMYAVLLLSASHYHAMNGRRSGIEQTDLLQLKSRALAEINTILGGSPSAVNDAVIGAVMKMAAYEAVYGDREAYAAHMRGLSLMIKMRGGLQQLGLDGLLERMVVWLDLNASHVTGSARITGGEDLPTRAKFKGADPSTFLALRGVKK